MLAGLLGWPFLLIGSLFWQSDWMRYAFIPIPVILYGVPYGVALAMIWAWLQGPVYGAIFGLNWPPRKHPRVWYAMIGTHLAAVAIAISYF